MKDQKFYLRINSIAAKLLADGVTSKNYDQETAMAILSNTCAPTKSIQILRENEADVINAIINEEAECLKAMQPKRMKNKFTSHEQVDLFNVNL